MRIFAPDVVAAKSRFWYFMALHKKLKKSVGEIVACSQVMKLLISGIIKWFIFSWRLRVCGRRREWGHIPCREKHPANLFTAKASQSSIKQNRISIESIEHNRISIESKNWGNIRLRLDCVRQLNFNRLIAFDLVRLVRSSNVRLDIWIKLTSSLKRSMNKTPWEIKAQIPCPYKSSSLPLHDG